MTHFRYLTCFVMIVYFAALSAADTPWLHGNLGVTDDGHYFRHADGTPFFWLGDTGWLLPERLDREEAVEYLDGVASAGFNVVQVQVVNGVPAQNAYGYLSHPSGYDFSGVDNDGPEGYWPHMDFIVDEAAKRGIYIGMVGIWGGLVKGGMMTVDEAVKYGRFLAARYKDKPNIIWIIGGDIKGDTKTDVWLALANSIKAVDRNHLMSFHPFGRTSSAWWFHGEPWLDFNMFQSGHRRYDQTRGDGDDKMQASVAEDNWRYVDEARKLQPAKPVLDAEPSYEDIPQGLHDPAEPWWKAPDVRRYAYWSVLSGAAGHTYGHSSVMQMKKPGIEGAYGAVMTWREGMSAPGYNQMKHLRSLVERFPFTEMIPDQSLVAAGNGERYNRIVAARGRDWMLFYNHTNIPFTVDMTKIEGKEKHAWWYDVTDGSVQYAGKYGLTEVAFHYVAQSPHDAVDRVLIVTASGADYGLPIE